MKKKKFLSIFACIAIFMFGLSDASQTHAQTNVTNTSRWYNKLQPKFSATSNIVNGLLFDNGNVRYKYTIPS